MQRLAQILLLAGGVLLATWIYAPAAPSPSPVPARVAEPVDQTAPLVAEMAAQTERMRTRLDEPQNFPPPERNPFTFGARREVVPPRPRLPVAAAEVPPPPPPALPKLLAIVANDGEGGTVVLTAIFSVGDNVQVVKAGDQIGAFVIRSVTAEGVELLDPVTSAVHRVTIR